MKYALLYLFLLMAIATYAVDFQNTDSLRVKRMSTLYFIDNKKVDSAIYYNTELKLIEDIKSHYSIGQRVIYRDEASQINVQACVREIVYNGIIVEYDSVTHRTFFIRQENSHIPKLEIIQPYDHKPRISLVKRLYNNETYDYQKNDKYIPMMNSIFSFVVPGSGQFICGDILGGIGYLSGGAFTLGVAALGAFSLSEGMYSPTLFYLGFISHIGIRICSAIDAHKLARTQNLYIRDRRLYNIHIAPYFKQTAFAPSYQPESGLKLSIYF